MPIFFSRFWRSCFALADDGETQSIFGFVRNGR